MNETPPRGESPAATITRAIVKPEAEPEALRATMPGLQRSVVEPSKRPPAPPAAEVVEANEQLVVALLRAQMDAETTALALDEMTSVAELDPLTRLPNRGLMLDRFAHAIAIAKRRDKRLALLFLDLDKLKQINDTFGHAVGDQVLKRVAQCVVASIRGSDTVSRHGGDEFLILLEVSHASDAVLVAEKVIAALAAPGRVGDHVLGVTVSIGISIYPDDSEDADTLIGLADAAMYRVKKNGGGGLLFHGDPPAGDGILEMPVRDPPRQTLTSHDQSIAYHEQRHATLREANQALVLAALAAQGQESAAVLAQQRQTEFLAMLAHELRNPLGPIRNAASLLTTAHTDGALLPRLQGIIERQVAHLSRLVGDILDLSRISTGKLTLQDGVVDMTSVIDNALAAFRPAMDARGQRLRVDRPPAGLAVRGDKVRLAQVLHNLLDNASKYSPEGGEIAVSAIAVDDEIVITVSDTGIGIPAAVMPRIFDAFLRGEQAVAFHSDGIGIGLTLVRELVGAHGGDVVASSAGAGLGSRFVVTLPSCQPPDGVLYRVTQRNSPSVALRMRGARGAPTSAVRRLAS